MAWYHAFTRRATLPTPEPTPQTVTAAATPVKHPRTELIRTTDTWQEEAWQFFDGLGEYNYAVTWESHMLSRVRLFAAKLEPGVDEPVRADAGAGVDFMTTLAGGVAGQAQLMANLAVQLSVPGEGYLVGETINGVEQWSVRSIDEVRAARGHFEVIDEAATSGTKWRALGADSLVTRVYRPHKRWHYMADSPARAARSTMRELELVNRHITAQYLSRLASAGVVIFPDEVSFPVREEFAEAADPFMAEWIEIAAEAIRTPGTASATVPVPMRVPGEYVDKIKHLDFTLKLDDKIIEKRDSTIKRLATQVNIPPEILLGMGDANHWTGWLLDESALKTNIAPDAELICQAVTTGYLQPRLKASGVEDAERWVVWYDMSELTMRPDRSANAVLAYDRMELSGTALRRETGFNEADKPTSDEIEQQALKSIIRSLPSGALDALGRLTGVQLTESPPEGTAPSAAPAAPEPEPAQQGPPATRDQPPPAAAVAEQRADRMLRQAKTPHAVRFAVGSPGEILHPPACTKHAYSCPYTHAAQRLDQKAPRPGTSGTYEARLDAFGRLTIGKPTPYLDTTGLITTRSLNGLAHSRR
ncbi:hypothetical protein QNO07_09245 [Streptomyces sp. 549]|uniref:hypothetical protein n=1 Tax=Streptomyces sp. 549 TaxID=3049076 RepID=UPI0024C25001|nr:hypothetical protein [Streptomyces sp. 549]MDK1473603.1 hypothetical protein [Streptomyces sp. 549]